MLEQLCQTFGLSDRRYCRVLSDPSKTVVDTPVVPSSRVSLFPSIYKYCKIAGQFFMKFGIDFFH